MTYSPSEDNIFPTKEDVKKLKDLIQKAREVGCEKYRQIKEMRGLQSKFYMHFEAKLRSKYYMKLKGRARLVFEDILEESLIQAFELYDWEKTPEKEQIKFSNFDMSIGGSPFVDRNLQVWIERGAKGPRLKYRVIEELKDLPLSLDEKIGDSSITFVEGTADPKTEINEATEIEAERRDARIQSANKLRGYKSYLSKVHLEGFPKCNGWAIISLLLNDEDGKFYSPNGSCYQKGIAIHFKVPQGKFSSWFRKTLIPLLQKLSGYKKETENEE